MAEKTINIDIKNSYGIVKFKHTFNFSSKSNFYTLYAQNGTVKSSLAKTLDDYSRGEEIKDHIFDVKGKCNVLGIDKEDIMSFPSFDGQVKITSEAGKLVSNDEIKQKYDNLLKDAVKARENFTQKLVEIAQYSSSDNPDKEIEEKMFRQFVKEDQAKSITLSKIVELMKSHEENIKNANQVFSNIPYVTLSHANLERFIGDKKYQNLYRDLAKAYDELKESADFYRNGFDASSAGKLVKAMKNSKYFDAHHAVSLENKDGELSENIKDLKSLESTLQTDLDKIIEKYPHLNKPLHDLINAFKVGTNSEVRTLFEDKSKRELLVFMGDKSKFYKNMWYSYLHECQEEIDTLIKTYEDIKQGVAKIAKEAEDCQSEWGEIVETFNNRFENMPYRIKIKNKTDLVLGEIELPMFEIQYANPRDKSLPYKEEPDSGGNIHKLNQTLSNGERKAFYLINVIALIENQLKKNKDTLVLFDDIVESFDYRNKYAFFEYLHDLSFRSDNLYIIVLTHNFDFYRLIRDKLHPREDGQFKIILKNEEGRIDVRDMFNPRIFSDIKAKASKNKSAWVGLIPLARNIVEYSRDSDDNDYKDLTKCLHVMPDKLIVSDVNNIINRILDRKNPDIYPFEADKDIHQAILESADEILNDISDNFDLYSNFTLSMAIRIQTEEYIISKISTKDYRTIVQSGKPQTRQLSKRYKNNASDNNKEEMKSLFSRSLLISDGSIHINSFMYEPLIDMGTWELKDIYRKLKEAANR